MNARSALSGLKHQKEKRNMDYFAGLDVSVKETSICIVDDTCINRARATASAGYHGAETR
jgi:hypothetical protein